MKIILTFFLAFMIGCSSTREIKIVSPSGESLSDAIVCQWNYAGGPLYSLAWKTRLYKTNCDGIVSIDPDLYTTIGKEGFFPVTIEPDQQQTPINDIILSDSKFDSSSVRGPMFYYLDSPAQIDIYTDWVKYTLWLDKKTGRNDSLKIDVLSP